MSSAGSRFVLPFQTVINAIGVPLPGAKLFFYVSGTDTPQNTYSNEALTIPNANPVEANSAGMFSNIFLVPHDYKVVLEDANGAEIWTADPVSPFTDTNTGDIAYDIIVYVEAKPGDGETYPVINAVRKFFLPVALTGSIFTIDPATPPTSAFAITIKKNGFSIGTVAFSVLGAPTVTFPNKISFVEGDQFSLTFPSPQDATAQNIALSFKPTLGT